MDEGIRHVGLASRASNGHAASGPDTSGRMTAM
jgi:hypothetical protein